MRRVIILVVIAVFMVGMTACGSSTAIEEKLQSVQDTMKDKATEAAKNAVLGQLEDFLGSVELGEGLGLTPEEQGQLKDSLKGYADSYDLDEEELAKATDAMKELLEKLKTSDAVAGITKEELDAKLAEILEQQ